MRTLCSVPPTGNVVFDSFLIKGLEFSGRSEAIATAGDLGAAGTSGASVGATGKAGKALPGAMGAGMEIYRMTQAGVSLQAQVTGTRYWKDGSLN